MIKTDFFLMNRNKLSFLLSRGKSDGSYVFSECTLCVLFKEQTSVTRTSIQSATSLQLQSCRHTDMLFHCHCELWWNIHHPYDRQKTKLMYRRLHPFLRCDHKLTYCFGSLKSLHTFPKNVCTTCLWNLNKIGWSKLHEILSSLTKNRFYFFKPLLTKRWRHFVRRFCRWNNCLMLNY